MSMAFLGVVMFMPLYMQVVQGINATQSGFALLPLMGGLIVSSIICGRLVTRTGRYKPFMIGGGIVLIVGVIVADAASGRTRRARSRVAAGDSPASVSGRRRSLFSLVIQNAAPLTEIGVATSMSQFSRQIGCDRRRRDLRHVPDARPDGRVAEARAAAAGRERASHRSRARAEPGDERRTMIRERVDEALDERFAVIERAYREDAAAVDEIVGDPRMPEQIKAALRDGGVRGARFIASSCNAPTLSRASSRRARRGAIDCCRIRTCPRA